MWWQKAFPQLDYQKSPPGKGNMLILIGYDISNPKRLSKVSKTCMNFGVRVQYSFFECYLTEDDFEELWLQLLCLIDEDEDRIVAYKLDAKCAKATETAGIMTCSKRYICYIV